MPTNHRFCTRRRNVSRFRRFLYTFAVLITLCLAGCETVIRYPDGTPLYQSNRVWQIGNVNASLVLAADGSTTATLTTDKGGVYGFLSGAAAALLAGPAFAP